MENVVDKLQHMGLTQYEAKAYLALLNTHLNTATQISEKIGRSPNQDLRSAGSVEA
jgi:sugar-specific transcriptional regulator TrmB